MKIVISLINSMDYEPINIQLFSGMGVAVSQSAMSAIKIISTGQMNVQAARNDTDADSKPENTDDSTFELLLGPLLASIFQNTQLTSSGTDTTKLNDWAKTAGNATAQPSTPSSTQELSKQSQKSICIQNEDAATNSENSIESQLSELIKNCNGNTENQNSIQKTTLETKDTTQEMSADDNAQAAKSNQDDMNATYLADKDKAEKRESTLLQNISGLNGKDKNDEDRQKANSTIVGPPKADFSSIVQQDQSSGLPTSHATADPSIENETSNAATRNNAIDASNAFDHAVTIMKDGNRLAVQLDHSGLGKLDINLSLDKGTVNAHINVADDATKKIIENNMQQIVNSILGEGVSVGGFSVSLRQQRNWDGSNQYQQNETRQSSNAGEPPVVSSSNNVAHGLVNIFI